MYSHERTWCEELAWCAAFFDAEGHIRVNRRRDRGDIAVPQITITQADTRVLYRFQRTVFCGTVHGPYKHSPAGHKPLYVYRANNLPQCQAIIVMIWPWLDEVKREQAYAALKASREAERVAPGKFEHRTACARGHPYNEHNTRFTTQKHGTAKARICRVCMREHQREYKRKRLVSALLEAV